MLDLKCRTLAGASILVFLAGTTACSGQVESTPGDGGSEASPDAPPFTGFEAGTFHEASLGPETSPGNGGDTCQGNPQSCIVPPSQPGSGAPAPSQHEYAVHKLYIGDTDRTGVSSPSAWKTYGYNLDGLVTTQSSTDVCTLAPGAARATQVDGNGGIDNSFGENFLPILLTTAGTNVDQTINASIAEGHPTNLVYVSGFDGTPGATTSAVGLTAALFGGADYAAVHGGAPSWNLGTHWPVAPETLNGCPNGVCPSGTDPLAAAKVQVTGAYQSDGLFVGRAPGAVAFGILFSGQRLPLTIHDGVVTFSPTAGGVTNGTIAGALSTQELVNALQQIAGAISTSLCSGSAFDSIAQQIEQGSDILLQANGGIANTPGVPCNATSIGLGFDATEIAVATPADIAPPTPPAPNPCGDQ